MSDVLSSRTNHTNHTNQSPVTETSEIVVYSTTWCGDCRRSKRVFADLGVPYKDVDIERDATAAALVRQLNSGSNTVPTIVFPDGSKLVEPSNQELEAKLRPFITR